MKRFNEIVQLLVFIIITQILVYLLFNLFDVTIKSHKETMKDEIKKIPYVNENTGTNKDAHMKKTMRRIVDSRNRAAELAAKSRDLKTHMQALE